MKSSDRVSIVIPAGPPIRPGLGGLLHVNFLLSEAGYSETERRAVIDALCRGEAVTLSVPAKMVPPAE